MNRIIQQIGAIFLSLLIMLSTVSFTVDVHVCDGSIVDVSFAQEELSCSSSNMGELTLAAHNAMRKMGCCNDLQFQLEGQDELQYSYLSVQIDKSDVIADTLNFNDFAWGYNSEESVIYTTYIPPPLIQDVQVLHQTFLL